MTIIDSHQHFWDLSKFNYEWMDKGSALQVNRMPADLKPLLTEAGVTHTVLIQAHSSIEETRWLLEIANRQKFVLGVTGWVDLTDPKVGDVLDDLQKDPMLKGIRHVWEDEADSSWLLTSGAIAGLKEVQRRDLCYEFLVRPRNLIYIPKIMEKVPDLRAVIDHIAKPVISDQKIEPWLSLMRDITHCSDLFCKISGMVTESDHINWSLDDLRPYVANVLDLFSHKRLMFGTDWPVCTLAASYASVVQTALCLIQEEASPDGMTSIFRDTAIEFYRLDAPERANS